MVLSLAQLYDRFQADAVKDISDDFKLKPNGRFLLVIPTGGGKTFTAVKAVNKLYEIGLLNLDNDRVLWTAHRRYLLDDAKLTFQRFADTQQGQKSILSSIDFEMVGKVKLFLKDNTKPKLVVIDEAHHAAADSYHPIFADSSIGILGLTATPSRHDGNPLDFERESYSIGFPELIELGVILRPNVIAVDGEFSEIESLVDVDDLEKFNTVSRNKKIINELLKRNDVLKKVVIYVGTKNHAKSLWEQLTASQVVGFYESVAYITGDENSRSESREVFIKKEKAFKRSILINVDVLTEGYDDPEVNTVFMARPTSSKLVYMQAIGRAIRKNPKDETKQAYVLEIVDKLPNIRYRIDNRWLYAELADSLEPAVEDRDFVSKDDLKSKLESIYDSYDVPSELRSNPTFDNSHRFGLLLFKVYAGHKKDFHIPILMDQHNRLQVLNFFNYMSERVPYFVKKGFSIDTIYGMAPTEGLLVLRDERYRTRIFEAMESSLSSDPLKRELNPWITYFSLKYRPAYPSFGESVKEFLQDMVNAKEVAKKIALSEYVRDSYLVRFPLPLSSYLGRIVLSEEFDEIQKLVDEFSSIRLKHCHQDHRGFISSLSDRPNLPVEPSLLPSIATIVRFQLSYGTKIAFGDQPCPTYCPS
jgi:superfamily II DNA or RNA helicase